MYLLNVIRTALNVMANYINMDGTTVTLSPEKQSQGFRFIEDSVLHAERRFLYCQIFFTHTLFIVDGSFKKHGYYGMCKKKVIVSFNLTFSQMKLEGFPIRQLNAGIHYGGLKRTP